MTIARPVAVCAVISALIIATTVIAPSAEDVETPAPSAAQEFHVGDSRDQAEVHLVTSPGLYGLGSGVPGSSYAVAHGKLIRIDPSSFKVLSILRDQPRLLD